MFRYDGQHYIVIADESSGLIDNRVRHISEDVARLTLATEQGLTVISKQTERMRSFSPASEIALDNALVASFLHNDEVIAIARSARIYRLSTELELQQSKVLQDGLIAYKALRCGLDNIYIATSQGLIDYDLIQQQAEFVALPAIGAEPIVDLACKDSNLFVASNSHVVSLKQDSSLLTLSDFSANDRIQAFAIDANHLTVATFNSYLLRFVTDAASATALQLSAQSRAPDVRQLLPTGNGEIWIATSSEGLLRIIDSEQYSQLINSATRAGCPAIDAEVYSVAKQRDELLISTYAQGIYRYSPDEQKCQPYLPQLAQQNSLLYENVVALHYHASGAVFIGSARKGLRIVQNGQVQYFSSRNGYEAAFDNINRIQSINDQVVLSTMAGLIVLDPNSLEYNIYTDNSSNRKLINRISVVAPFGQNLILGTDYGVLLFDLNSREFSGEQFFPIKGTVYDLAIDSQGHLVYSVEGKGVYQAQLNTNLEDTNSKLLIRNSTAYSIVRDAADRFWLATSQGIYRYHARMDEALLLTAEYGLQAIDHNTGGIYDAANNQVIIPSVNGVRVINVDQFDESKVVNSPVLSQISYLSQHKNITHSLALEQQPLAQLEQLQLDYDHSLLRLKVSNYELQFPRSTKIRYRLEGVIDDWVELEFGEAIILNRIPTGSYRLLLNSLSLNGTWNESVRSLPINILPPWYLTTTAKVSYLVIALLLALLFFQIKTRALQKRAQLLAKAVDVRTQELAQEKRNVEHLLQTKNREFANVSHEFRTPLTLVLGPVSRLLEKEEAEEKRSKLELVKKNTFRLMRMVDQLIYLEKLRVNKALKRKPIPVSQLFKFITDSFEDLCLLRNIKFRVEYERDIWCLSTKESVEKVMLNLLSNALKYTPEYGEIVARLESCQESFVFSVSDTGYGIAPDQQERVFERFERVNDENSESITGAGIGLSLVKELLDQHEATITLVSELGKGSQFTVTWPTIEAPEDANEMDILGSDALELELETLRGQSSQPTTQADNLAAADDSDSRALVLVIEDNPDMRSYIQETVQNRYRCITAKDGAEGIELAKEQIPDLIISDVMMPKQDGFAVSETLKSNEKTSHIPIILLTARGDKESRMTGWQKNVDEYLTKPFDEDELLIRIDNLLSIREILKQRFAERVAKGAEESAGSPLQEDEISRIDQKFLAKLDAVLADGYADNQFNAAKLAEVLGYSERQLQRKLKSLIDFSPNEYLRHYRLNQALKKLQEGELIKVVAFDCGFTTVPHFSSCFKAKFGMTPKQAQS